MKDSPMPKQSEDELDEQIVEIIKRPMRSQISTSDIVVGMWSSTALGEKVHDLEQLFHRYAQKMVVEELKMLRANAQPFGWNEFFGIDAKKLDARITALEKEGKSDG